MWQTLASATSIPYSFLLQKRAVAMTMIFNHILFLKYKEEEGRDTERRQRDRDVLRQKERGQNSPLFL